jgi:hypothetical protein
VVEIVLTRGAYLRLGDDGWILLAGPRAPMGPLTLRLAGLPAARLPAPATPVRRAGGRLVAGTLVIDLATAGTRSPTPPGCPRPGSGIALAAALGAAASPPRHVRPGLAALRAGRLERAVELLAGRGRGLTPDGDDVLAGYLAWNRHAAPTILVAAERRCTPLGLAYLRCAAHGELPDPVARLLATIATGDASLARRRAAALTSWGSSSGAAMLWGAAAAAGRSARS